ncbi:hypothetical protein MUU72_09275 [Streptomyces sp. RS10V-4]|uniref:hypothetical protein n=1 Tax=Streptomyces rhizoryzae TaxID=2932493 RepID=UPI0020049710|nr:hypothetical protein [Streptomyces rhizoryzae]MCK7623284.1 hypothetical protein [Streptomyces rhizoryzae]
MTDSGKNDPLPVKSREQAERSARTLIDSLARQYGLQVDGTTVRREFFECFGKNHEHASDGRFDLSYSVRAHLPGEEHGKALRPMRKRLEAEGYRILSGYREDPSQALMDAKGGSDNFFVSVESYLPPTDLVFSVRTPCFLPPGVKQQQLSAPAPDAAPGAPEDPRLALMAPVRSVPAGNPFG